MPILIDEVTAEVAPAATAPNAAAHPPASPPAEPDPRVVREQLERLEVRMARVRAD